VKADRNSRTSVRRIHRRVFAGGVWTGPVFAAISIAAAFACIPSVHATNLDFLVPGISLRSVAFESGSRVAYMVVSESYGIADTSLVELAVLEASGGRILLEVSSAPYPRFPAETVWVKMRLFDRVKKISSPDEFLSCVDEILVREGDAESFREASRDEIEELDLERMFLPSPADTERVHLGHEEIETPAGVFSCDRHEMKREENRPVTLGGVAAQRFEREHTVLWLSGDVPFWGLVRSRIERESSTKLAGRTRRGLGTRSTVTESILLSYSRNAVD
jgi:hypothetical protein